MVWKLGKSLYEKVMTKRRCKKGWSSSAHWQKFHQKLVSYLQIGVSQKKDESWAYTFLWKTTRISRFVILPLKMLDKTKLFIPKKSCKIIWHLLGMKPFVILKLFGISSVLPLKILVIYFLFSPRKFYIVFLQYSWKIQILGQFCDFTWTDKLLIMKFLGE